ncbi:hypothetical protein F5Y09DRAFT_323578 [Xylaria sp. FL1042]|nr:hypothetical protein F5Y09DRAFT_323578 [Xylaria sp. FL1042]
MPPPKHTTNNDELAPREQRILALAWYHMTTFPEVDAQGLADRAGLKNPRSVLNVLSAVKKKLGIPGKVSGSSAATSSNVTTQAKRKADDVDESADNEDVPSAKKAKKTPAKSTGKGKGKGKGKSVTFAEEDDEVDDDEEI